MERFSEICNPPLPNSYWARWRLAVAEFVGRNDRSAFTALCKCYSFGQS